MAGNSTTLSIIISAKDQASKVLGSVGGSLGKLGAAATATTAVGIAAIGAGLAGAAAAGLGFNNEVEQVTAKLNAFTKNGAVTARMLEQIKTEANSTPFAFTEMANAMTALMPAAKQSGTEVMNLVKQAEILAASNPAQGLEGAAFALKEALGGDFTSIIERFNLPRQYINQLKDQGVPAMEAVSMAMKQMGLDASLVANMAGTMQGRWSTFTDTLTSLAGTVTQPIFDTLSSGLGNVNSWLERNSESANAMATAIAGRVNSALMQFGAAVQSAQAGDLRSMIMNISAALSSLGVPQSIIDFVQNFIPLAVQKFDEFGAKMNTTLGPAMTAIGNAFDRIVVAFGGAPTSMGTAGAAASALGAVLDAVVISIQLAAITAEGLAIGAEKISQAVGIAKGLWENWNTILASNSTDPAVVAVKALAEALETLLNPIGAAKQAWTDLSSAWANIQMPDLTMPRLDTSSIPPWLIPGSPTPFEIGLQGIQQQISAINSAPLKPIGVAESSTWSKDWLRSLEASGDLDAGKYFALYGHGRRRPSPSAERERAEWDEMLRPLRDPMGFELERLQAQKQRHQEGVQAEQQRYIQAQQEAQQRRQQTQSMATIVAPPVLPPPIPAANQVGSVPGPAGPSPELAALNATMTGIAAQLAALANRPIQIEVPVSLDGAVIARVVSGNQGQQLQNAGRMGGRAGL